MASRDVLSYLAGRRAALEKERRYAHALARPRSRRPARREASREATGLWRAVAALVAAEERRRVERELEASWQEPRPQHRRPLGPADQFLHREWIYDEWSTEAADDYEDGAELGAE